MENKRKALGKGLEQLFNSEPLNLDTLNNYEKEIVETAKESDILELADQFGGLIMHRSDRLAYTVPEALEILVSKNMKDSDNKYLATFQEFVDIMEDIEV